MNILPYSVVNFNHGSHNELIARFTYSDKYPGVPTDIASSGDIWSSGIKNVIGYHFGISSFNSIRSNLNVSITYNTNTGDFAFYTNTVHCAGYFHVKFRG